MILGIIAGGLSNVTSGGAGILTIYLLTNYGGITIQKSTGTVLAASTFIVLIGALSFYKRKQVNTQLAITVGLSGVVGAFFAARWASSIDSVTFEHIFGTFTLALAVYMTFRYVNEWKKSKKSSKVSPINPSNAGAGFGEGNNLGVNPPVSAAYNGGSPQKIAQPSRWSGTDPLAISVQVAKGVLIGIATGLFGVGLASLSIVLFILLFKLDTKMILGTSLFASFFRYLGGSIGYLSAGQIDPLFFFIILVGGGIRSYFGARIVLGTGIIPWRKGKRGAGETGTGIKDSYVKVVVIGILLFITYEFLIK